MDPEILKGLPNLDPRSAEVSTNFEDFLAAQPAAIRRAVELSRGGMSPSKACEVARVTKEEWAEFERAAREELLG